MTRLIKVPMRDHFLNTTDSKTFEYFRKPYEDFMGVSTSVIKCNIYTLEEQIERYAKNLTFWYLQMAKMVDYKHKNKMGKILFIKSQVERLMNTIEHIFPELVQELVYEKANHMKLIYS